jgi:hypothetical protein
MFERHNALILAEREKLLARDLKPVPVPELQKPL